MLKLWIGFVIAFLVSALCGKSLIPLLHRLKFGQEIREEGPKWHEKKSGTPTMGGFLFILGILAGILAVWAVSVWQGEQLLLPHLALLAAISLAFAAIGFLDDYIKVILKRNLGLTAAQKFGLQFLVALAFVCWVVFGGHISTSILLPFTEARLELGWFYLPFTVLVILASVNSVNLTDGLDGLATCVTMVVTLFFLLFTTFGNFSNPTVAVFAATVLGGLAGFLLYNKYPAKVFMGDTGSLCLGGAVCGMAILTEQPLTLLIVGFVYVMESLSVILQVASFKLTGKRIFKMSPLHHHFEMCGWSEKKIVAVFTLVTVILCAWMFFWGRSA